jgi:Mn-containing catalase
MFHHVKDLQFNARVSRPDPRFANLLLEQFGGENGELAAAMQYFTQAFGAKHAAPGQIRYADGYRHRGIQPPGNCRRYYTDVVKRGQRRIERMPPTKRDHAGAMNGKAAKESIIHQCGYYRQPPVRIITGGGVTPRNSQGIPWCASYIHSNGDLTVDLRSNLASESRAKLVYEHLMKFTDDPYIHETLSFLMTREVTHYKMFEAALMHRSSLISLRAFWRLIQGLRSRPLICPMDKRFADPGTKAKCPVPV